MERVATMSKGISAGRSVFLQPEDIDQKYRSELEDVLENVRAIHGGAFVQHVQFFMNINSMIALVIRNTTLNDDCSPEQMRDVLSQISAQLVASHAEALGLDDNEETGRAVINTVNTLQGIVKQVEIDMNKGRHG